MTRPRFGSSCCTTTPSAVGLWAAIFLLVYGGGLLLGSAWPPLREYQNTLILAAMGTACVINFGRNRTLHCGLSGPLFALFALLAALIEAEVWDVDIDLVWGITLVGVVIAFIVEWRFAGTPNRTAAR